MSALDGVCVSCLSHPGQMPAVVKITPKQRIDELLQAEQGQCGFTQHLVNRLFFFYCLYFQVPLLRDRKESPMTASGCWQLPFSRAVGLSS